MTIKFCDQCNNLMYPRAQMKSDLTSDLMYMCSNADCENFEIQDEGNYLIDRNVLGGQTGEQQLPSEYVRRGLKDDPTLPKESHSCLGPDCYGREARLLHVTKGEDQGLQQYLICCECARTTKKV